MPNIVGGCLCGAVRYESEAEPVLTAVCHCRDCQKQTSSAFSVLVVLPKDSLRTERGLGFRADRGRGHRTDDDPQVLSGVRLGHSERRRGNA